MFGNNSKYEHKSEPDEWQNMFVKSRFFTIIIPIVARHAVRFTEDSVVIEVRRIGVLL